MKTKLNPDGRYLTKDGSVQVPMHPLWVLARYPFRNITDLWSLRNPLRWYRYGNWRYFVRTLPGEHATPGELAAFDQRAAEIRELGVLRFGRKPRHEGGPDAG